MTDQVTGFSYEEKMKEWRSTNFKAGRKYLIRRPDPKGMDKENPWVVYEFGENYPKMWCFKEINDDGSLYCGGMFDFRFNKNTLRFLKGYQFGYVAQGTAEKPDNDDDTPTLRL